MIIILQQKQEQIVEKKINENYEDWLHICEDYFNYEKWLVVMLLKTDRYFSLYLPNTQPSLEETFIFPFHETCLEKDMLF